ncbi:MAG: hypothetical protein KGJ59_01670 [Bacteroidota bacterium]|nr:hypothetical protein [Bacteroidota bacterium]
MNTIAESYVKLVLKTGLHDSDVVDAYYGPEIWKPAKDKSVCPLDHLHQEADDLLQKIDRLPANARASPDELRRIALRAQLVAVRTKIEMLQGKSFPFDEESRLLYDAVAPMHTREYFEAMLDDLGTLLPGPGKVSQRVEQFKRAFVIPKEKLEAVFSAAIKEGRRRTLEHIELPENENFVVEYVTEKAWSGYNWYKGNSFSTIQMNTDFPIYVDRAIDLACHEGYPGHHVYNSLMEKHLVRKRGWMEFSVYPLFSPQSLIAEGSANFGIEVAFPGNERVQFEQEALFPIAGFDPSRAEHYYSIHVLTLKLSYAGNEAARRYLNGTINKDEAVHWLVTYALFTPERAEQRVRFFDKYRSYVINYNLGQDMVKAYVERRGGASENSEQRWKIFKELLSNPITPSALI